MRLCRFGSVKVVVPFAAVGRSEKREQRLVLIDREDLTVRQGPALGGKAPRDDFDLRKKRLRHRLFLSCRGGSHLSIDVPQVLPRR
jgi:hypothetical protein